MKFQKIISGGFFSGRRTRIISCAGIISAAAAYAAGDADLFETMNTVFTLAGIYFLRKSTERSKNANSKKISKR